MSGNEPALAPLSLPIRVICRRNICFYHARSEQRLKDVAVNEVAALSIRAGHLRRRPGAISRRQQYAQ